MTMYRVAAIQMASGPHVIANLSETGRLIGEAVNMGAKLIILPENFVIMGIKETDKVDIREKMGDTNAPIQHFLSQQAAHHGVWLVGGTIPIAADDPHKVRASCLVYDNKGKCVTRYDKIHLFDVSTTDEEHYFESGTIEAGDQIVVIDSPFGRLGLAICYDLRFPELFRCMLSQGVEIIIVPAAFTALTGKAHWELLVRARAIENLCYVIAANQGGYHVNGRETHGHSMIVDPWGCVLTRLQRGTGVICADIDLEQQRVLRRKFPVIQHIKIKSHMNYKL